jgi:hypothetical protein
MQYLPLPQPGELHIQYDVSIDTSIYYVRIYYNSRSENWYIDFSTISGPIVQGKMLSVGYNIFLRCHNPAQPSGGIYFIDPSGKNLEASKDTLATYALVYDDE